jgi:cation diffusion facilitator CzcD-associated flavoprotein CzcO
MQEIETDYLIIGSGAMGMAFADSLLTESKADMVMVDRHAKPGGHWNVALSVCEPASALGVFWRGVARIEPI